MARPKQPTGLGRDKVAALSLRSRGQAKAILTVLLVAAIAKANTVAAVFAWDDENLIIENVHVRNLRRVPSFFAPSYWRHHHMAGGEVYRPIRLSSFALDYALWGLRPVGFHITNGLLHLLNVLLVCLLLRKWPSTRRFWFVAALLFAVWPTGVETVAWIKNRSDLFAAAFFLAALVAMPLPFGGVPARGRCVAATLLFALALMAKEAAIGLPLMLMFVFADPRRWRRAWAATVPFWVVAIGYLLVRAEFLITPPSVSGAASAPGLLDRAAAAAATFAAYARLLVLPAGLTLDHLPPVDTLLASHLGQGLAVAAAVVLAALSWRIAAVGVLWFAIALLPVSNLVPLRDRPLAEQRLYVAALGFCILLAAAARSRGTRRVTLSLLYVATIAACLLAIERAGLWTSNIELWRAAVRVTPKLVRPLANFGNAYAFHKRHDRAEVEYRRALRANPKSCEATLRLGEVFEARGDAEKALSHYRQATQLAPRSVVARYREGNLLRKQGRFEQAIQCYQQILDIKPRSPDAWHRIALVQHARGDVPSALEACAKAIALEPAHFRARRMRAVLLMETQPEQALRDLTAAIESNPGYVVAYVERARLHIAQGRRGQAHSDIMRALKIDPNDVEAWRLLDQLDTSSRTPSSTSASPSPGR